MKLQNNKDKKSNINILAIESSCDETAVAVIEERNGQPEILANVINSQVDLHAKTGGVVPEVASRAHMESVIPVISEALLQSFGDTSGPIDYGKAIDLLHKNITHIAYTAGPGLIGSLLVGYNAAKTISAAGNLPIIPVNHIEGHIYSAFSLLPKKEFQFPVLALTVSGGHSSLTLMKDHGQYLNVGHTIDDAAGEAFDKVAKLLDLGYPGGPAVSKAAEAFRMTGVSNPFIFPRPILNDGTLNFSFSGLKTAVLQKILSLGHDIKEQDKIAICAAFEDAVVDVLTIKSLRACEKYNPKTFVLAGGVAANTRLRTVLEQKVNEIKGNKVKLLIPPISLCGDNAVMIGMAAFYRAKNNQIFSWEDVTIDSNLELGSC